MLSMEIVLTGIKPTGTLHIGNYVGAMLPAVAASRNPNVHPYFFIADYHAIGGDADKLARSTLEITASWLAVVTKLDPRRRSPSRVSCEKCSSVFHRESPPSRPASDQRSRVVPRS